jgi:hypothetical protein
VKIIKLAVPILVAVCLSLCAPKAEKVDRVIENGVEVVLNPLHPVKTTSEPCHLSLQEGLTIDTEKDEIAKIGLTDMETFDVDSEENIYIIRWQSDGNYIYKFDARGNFLKSFYRRGQGPGELEYGGTVTVLRNGEIMAKDPGAIKFLVFDRDGNWLREDQLGSYKDPEFELQDGKWLTFWQDQELDFIYNHYGLCDSKFLNAKELEGFKWPNPQIANTIPAFGHPFILTASNKNIYLGKADSGYEIHVYTTDGNLHRKILKKYTSLRVPDEIKQKYAKPQSNPFLEARRKKIAFPDSMPPFRYAFADDEDRLYIMTYEKAKAPREYMYDIYDSRGVFRERMSLGNFGERGPWRESELKACAKNDRLYYVRQKENGYKELVVCRMNWTK